MAACYARQHWRCRHHDRHRWQRHVPESRSRVADRLERSGSPRELLIDIFNIVNEETRNQVESPAVRALREGVVVGLANHTLLIAKDGKERPIDDSAAPIRNAKEEIAGVVLVFRDITGTQMRRTGDGAPGRDCPRLLTTPSSARI